MHNHSILMVLKIQLLQQLFYDKRRKRLEEDDIRRRKEIIMVWDGPYGFILNVLYYNILI